MNVISSDNLREVHAALCVVPIKIRWEAIATAARASYSHRDLTLQGQGTSSDFVQDLSGLDLA